MDGRWVGSDLVQEAGDISGSGRSGWVRISVCRIPKFGPSCNSGGEMLYCCTADKTVIDLISAMTARHNVAVVQFVFLEVKVCKLLRRWLVFRVRQTPYHVITLYVYTSPLTRGLLHEPLIHGSFHKYWSDPWINFLFPLKRSKFFWIGLKRRPREAVTSSRR